MGGIGLRIIAFIALLLGANITAFADDLSLPQGSTICADPTPVEKLACRIHREAVWTVASQLSGIAKKYGIVDASPSSPRPEAVEEGIRHVAAALRRAGVEVDDLRKQYQQQAILSALDAIPVLVSYANYGYAKHNNSEFKPPQNSAEVLEANSGLCGNAAELFKAVLAKLGLMTRTVQFWWRDDNGIRQNHIAVEVFWNSRWRLYDPTYGAYFVEVGNEDAGPLDVHSANSVDFRAMVNPNGTTYRNYRLAGLEPFDYLQRPNVDVTIASKGTINVYPKESNGELIATFEDVPNYIGDNRSDGDANGLRIRFPGLSGQFNVTVDVVGAWGCQSSVPRLNEIPFPLTGGHHVIRDVVDPSILDVAGPDDVCYVILKFIKFDSVDKH